MKNSIKRTLSVITASALMFGGISNVPLKPVESVGFSASAVVTNPLVTVLNCGENGVQALVNFRLNETARTAEIYFCNISRDCTIKIPDTITFRGKNYNVTSISEGAFSGCTHLIGVTGGKNLTTIGKNAFKNCSNLTSLYYCYNVSSIGAYAFSGCTKLFDTDVFSKCESIGEYAFYKCNFLSGVSGAIFIQNIKEIGAYAFGYCKSIKKVNLGAKLTTIPNRAFYGCSNLKTVVFDQESKVNKIGEYAFAACSSLTHITIPEGVSSIEMGTFYGDNSLEYVITPDNLATVKSYAFCGCSSMKFFVNGNVNTTYSDQSVGYDAPGQKTKGFVIWGNSNSTNAQRYANANGFTFKEKNEPSKKMLDHLESFNNCALGLENLPQYFDDSSTDNIGIYYYLTSHKQIVNQVGNARLQSQGDCWGMSALSALAFSGKIQVSDIAASMSGVRTLHDINSNNISQNVISLINTLQNTQSFIDDYYNYRNLSKETIKYLEYINYGCQPPLLSISRHAIVCYGVQFKNDLTNNALRTSWHCGIGSEDLKCDMRIFIYDPNRAKVNEETAIYVNTQTGYWSYEWMGCNSGNSSFNLNCSADTMFLYDSIEKDTNTFYTSGDEFVNAMINLAR